MRSVLAGSAIAAVFCLASTGAWAQDEQAKPADTVAPASGQAAAQPAQRKVRRNKYTDYWAQRAALKAAAQPRSVASAEAVPQPIAAQAPTVLPNPAAMPPSKPSMDADVATLDAGVDGEGLDSLPGIAAAHEAPAPVHPVAIPAATHAPAQAEHGSAHGAGHESTGEHGGHAKFSPGTFALQLLNFGALLFLLIYFGGKAMNKSLRARHEQLKAELAEAARLREEAQQKASEQGRRLTELEKELSALRTSMRADSEREQARMLEGAQERAKKIQEEMRFQIDQQVKEAELLLRAEVANASVKLAEELVRKSVDPLDQRRLAQEFVAGFDGQGTSTGGES